MPSLSRLNLAENKVAEVNGLADMAQITKLTEVEIAGNPVEEGGANLRFEVLIFQPGVTLIGADEVQEEEREGAKELNETRLAEERERLRLEAEAAAEAAAAAAEEAAIAEAAAAEAAAEEEVRIAAEQAAAAEEAAAAAAAAADAAEATVEVEAEDGE